LLVFYTQFLNLAIIFPQYYTIKEQGKSVSDDDEKEFTVKMVDIFDEIKDDMVQSIYGETAAKISRQ
jgi:hypothetical protein